ncbi:MAG: hypothetical protein IPP71_00995 [Bacteroidetes bacterium]|nr:hypothetical protein [Bacteroidota bacterium]
MLLWSQFNESFDTDKPGLYGLDVMAVDGSTNSSYTASSWIHKPIIVAPTDNHQLIFNIKDSYFAVLYGKPFDLMNVCKQVELNGHVIWREDISEGGDGWEQVQIDLMGQYVDENNTSHDITDYFDAQTPTQTITFSIAMDDPGFVLTDGGVPMTGYSVLRGLRVWVDDVYLKRFDNPGNLISDGDVEGATSGMSDEPKTDCIWYFKI